LKGPERHEAAARELVMFVVGLTGGIASGKSTVSQMFEKAGVPVVCADELAHELVKSGSQALQEIERAFGRDVIDGNGELNRPAMARLVFQDESKRKRLECIIHPRVREAAAQRTRKLEEAGYGMVIVDVPLLFEVGWDTLDAVVVVYAPRTVQERRLMDRDGLSKEEAEARLGAQMSLEEKKNRADYVIDNTGSLDQTLAQVRETLKLLGNKARLKNAQRPGDSRGA